MKIKSLVFSLTLALAMAIPAMLSFAAEISPRTPFAMHQPRCPKSLRK